MCILACDAEKCICRMATSCIFAFFPFGTPPPPPSWNRYGPEVTFLCMRWGRGDHCYRIYVQPHHYPLTPRKSKKMFPPPPFLNWLLLPCFFHISILVWLWPFHEYCCCSLEKRKNTFFSIQVFVVSVKADTSILQNKDCKQIITMFWCQKYIFFVLSVARVF